MPKFSEKELRGKVGPKEIEERSVPIETGCSLSRHQEGAISKKRSKRLDADTNHYRWMKPMPLVTHSGNMVCRVQEVMETSV